MTTPPPRSNPPPPADSPAVRPITASSGVLADSVAAGAVAAGSTVAGSVVAGSVVAGSVAAGGVAAGSVAAGSVAAGSVAAGSVAAGSVAAKRGTQVRVALAQIDPVLGDLERNLVLHEQMLAEARRHQADLVVFPELSLTGYYLRDLVADVARPAECHELQRLAAAAGTMAVVVGFVEHDAHGDLFNSAAFLEDGAVRHVHRKVYLPTYGLFDEQRYFAAGHRVRAFDSRRLGRIGVVVCEDFWHLSVATILQAERVDWLLCLANSPARGVREAEVRTASTYRYIGQTYAQLLGAHVAVCNRAGVEEGLCFWGGSFLVAPDGEIAAAAPPLDAHLLVVDVDANAPRRARLQTPLGRDERLSVTLGELGRIQRRQYESD